MPSIGTLDLDVRLGRRLAERFGMRNVYVVTDRALAGIGYQDPLAYADSNPPWDVVGLDGTSTRTSIGIIWQTAGVATTATVKVGLSVDSLNLQSITLTDFANSHYVLSTGLTPNTTYFFNVTFTDGQSSGTSSCDSAPCITTFQHVLTQ